MSNEGNSGAAAQGKPESNPGDAHAVVKVRVEHLASLQEVQLDAKWTDTVQQVWDAALAPDKLNEPRRPGDKLQTSDGVDVMPYLTLTLRQLRDEHGIKSHKFEIVGDTGGALS